MNLTGWIFLVAGLTILGYGLYELAEPLATVILGTILVLLAVSVSGADGRDR